MVFVVKEFEALIADNSTERVIGIGIKDNDGIILPSPLSNFIKMEYRNLEINSQRNAAYALTRFLNYLTNEVANNALPELKKGLPYLNLKHLASYITHLSIRCRQGNLSESYVMQDFMYLNNFYYWIKRQGILLEDFRTSYVEKSSVNKGNHWNSKNDVKKNLLKLNDIEVIYPLRNGISGGKIKDFGEGKEYLIKHLITSAQSVDPLLALPIALEIFGGLRRAEVVNLTIDSFKWSEQSLIVEIRDNQEILFKELKNTSDLQVKRTRDQVCMGKATLQVLFNRHLELLQRCDVKNQKSIFINYRTGKPMTGKNFSGRFVTVKDCFLKDLKDNNLFEDFVALSETPWGSHIGRGIYTNILYRLNLSSTQIAIARGDQNIDSARAYVDEKQTLKILETALEKFAIDL